MSETTSPGIRDLIQQLVVRTGGMGSHWGSNPRPRALAVDALTTELQLPAATQHSPSVFELEEQANDEGEGQGNM